MDNRNQFSVRVLIVYLLALPVMWFLIEAGWGAAGGLVVFPSIIPTLTSPEFGQKMADFAKEKGIDLNQFGKDPKTAREAFNNLPPKDKEELKKMVLENLEMPKIGLGFTLTVCVIIFGIIGFIAGLFAKSWMYVGFLPTASFFFNNPIIRFKIISDMPPVQKATVIIGQFAAAYLFAYLGSKLTTKKKPVN